MAPGAEDAANISLGVGMRDVEDIIFFAALVPPKLAIEAGMDERNVAVDGDTVLLSSRTGQRRPQY